MRENRGSWYLLTGVVIGIALGLLYAWVLRPVQYTNTSPKTLRADYKDHYRGMIAAAYLSNGDLVRARARLDLLGDTDLYQVLAEQAQRTLAESGSSLEARALGILAVALGQAPDLAAPSPPPGTAVSPTLALSGTPARTPADTTTQAAPIARTATASPGSAGGPSTPDTSTATSRSTQTAEPSGTPLPTRTPTPTQGAPFVLDNQELVCNPDLTTPLIQVETLDAAEQPVPGVEVIIVWEGGENRFFTGLKPEVSLGYADFDMTPGITYTLHLAEGGQPIQGLAATECEGEGGERYWGSWSLIFIQP